MKGDKDTKYMVKQTIEYSDGSETILTFRKNPDGELIEEKVAEAAEGDHKTATVEDEMISEEI